MSHQNVRVVVRVRPFSKQEELLNHVGPPQPGLGGGFGSPLDLESSADNNGGIVWDQTVHHIDRVSN